MSLIELTIVCGVVNPIDDDMNFIRGVTNLIFDNVQMEAPIQLATPLMKCMKSPIELAITHYFTNLIDDTFCFYNASANSIGNNYVFQKKLFKIEWF